MEREKLLVEFDRLKLRVAELAADLWDANAALDEAQSWLDTISEPMLEWRQGKKDVADAIELTNQYISSYLGSQKEKPITHEHRSAPIENYPYATAHTGKKGDCPICNPKSKDIDSCGFEAKGKAKEVRTWLNQT